MDDIKNTNSLYKKIAVVAIAAAVGLAFGALARWLYRSFDVPEGGQGLRWLIVHLTSGNWLWVVLTLLVSWWLLRRVAIDGWRRYVWAVVLAEVFLVATSVIWYSGGITSFGTFLTLLCSAAAWCLLVSLGVGFVVAYASRDDRLGLIARICLLLGLLFVILYSERAPVSGLEEPMGLTIAWYIKIITSLAVGGYIVMRHKLIRKNS